MVVLTLGKSLALTILLSVIIYGLGEIYLGVINRGVIVLIVGVGVSLAASLLLPFYIAAPIIVAYRIWRLVDGYQQYRKLNIPLVRESNNGQYLMDWAGHCHKPRLTLLLGQNIKCINIKCILLTR